LGVREDCPRKPGAITPPIIEAGARDFRTAHHVENSKALANPVVRPVLVSGYGFAFAAQLHVPAVVVADWGVLSDEIRDAGPERIALFLEDFDPFGGLAQLFLEGLCHLAWRVSGELFLLTAQPFHVDHKATKFGVHTDQPIAVDVRPLGQAGLPDQVRVRPY